MSFLYFFKLGFLIIYTSISAGIAYYIYNGEKKYYEPIYVLKKTGEGKDDEKTIYLHDEFDVLTRKDAPVSYPRLLFGTLTLLIFKLIVSLSIAFIHSIRLLFLLRKKKKSTNKEYTKEEIQQVIKSTNTWTNLFLKFSGIFYYKSRLPDEVVLPVYQKYFGPEYKIDYDGKFCCYI